MVSLLHTLSQSLTQFSIQPQLQHNHQNLINYHLIRRFHPTPLSLTSILLRWCQNSHRLLPNCREENHPLRCPMIFHSNLLNTSMDSFPKPESSNPNQRRRETTKSVLQLSVHEEGIRKKAWVAVSRFSGVTSIEMDDKTGKMTVVGEVDVPRIVKKLRKICSAELVTVEVVKPSEKKPEPKKPDDFVAYPFSINYPYPYHSYYPPYCYCNCGGATK